MTDWLAEVWEQKDYPGGGFDASMRFTSIGQIRAFIWRQRLDRPEMRRVGPSCKTYWGSHGCGKKPGHRGKHRDYCTPAWMRLLPDRWRGGRVGAYPFYGPETGFYGGDVL